MNDRELLELAAKAAGIELDCSIRPDGLPFYHTDRNAFAVAGGGWFSPLTDDGDALRLAVKLRLISPEPDPRIVTASLDVSDPYAATRRAIVRAAAEIGRKA